MEMANLLPQVDMPGLRSNPNPQAFSNALLRLDRAPVGGLVLNLPQERIIRLQKEMHPPMLHIITFTAENT